MQSTKWTSLSAVIKPSPIHGKGVFATHNILKGTRVFNENLKYKVYDLNTLLPYQRSLCQFSTENEGIGPITFDEDKIEVEWFLNHSFTPNVTNITENQWITTHDPKTGEEILTNASEDQWFASRDIKSGEEITIDYNQLHEPEHLKEPFYRLSN